MKKFKLLCLFVCLFVLAKTGFGQDTLRVEGIIKVEKGSEMKINPGTIVAFKPGGRIVVEGSFLAIGTPEKPIHFVSESKNYQGFGIQVNGVNNLGKIIVKNATFSNLLLPLNFEPFWSRNEVLLDGLTFRDSEFNEFVIFVAAPLNNQNINPISFKLINSYFLNNSSGIVIENAGSSGIIHELNNLVFQENRILGIDTSFGILQLNISAPFVSKNLQIGKLAFHNNFIGKTEIGISMSGSLENVLGKGIFFNNGKRLVYDYQADPRLPSLQAPVRNLLEWPNPFCFYASISHIDQQIILGGSTNCLPKSILDSSGMPLLFNQLSANDSLFLNYQGGVAKTLIMENDLKILLPAQIITKDTQQIPEQIIAGIDLDKPSFTPSYEVGGLGGLAFYVGDIHHKFGIPGLFEYTGGVFLQYNYKKNWSFRGTFYRTNIGMHDPTAPVFIWQGEPQYYDDQGNIGRTWSWDVNFKTKMAILNIDAIWYFSQSRNLMMTNAERNKGRFIPALGFGVGINRFDPYRCVVYSKNKDTAEYMLLRPFGTEGQNFLSNKNAYGKYALDFNASIQLAYFYKKFRFRYEFKAVLSMSDYLDDYGAGTAYGGDYDQWLATQPNVDFPVDKRTGKQISYANIFRDYNPTYMRTNNLLPDMYFQQHLGISYDIGYINFKQFFKK